MSIMADTKVFQILYKSYIFMIYEDLNSYTEFFVIVRYLIRTTYIMNGGYMRNRVLIKER
jgi:hypothetical protein